MSKLMLTAALALAAVVASTGLRAEARPAPAGGQGAGEEAARNLRIVRSAFERWAAGGSGFFDEVLADDVRWTIMGSGPEARTYVGREAFVREAAAPLTTRLKGPIRPKVRHLLADGDVVVAVFDGEAVARDGRPYANNFVWVMRMRDGRAFEVEAFLDLDRYREVVRRVPPA